MTKISRFVPAVALLLSGASAYAEPSAFSGVQIGILGGAQIGQTKVRNDLTVSHTTLAPTGLQGGLHVGYGTTFDTLFVGFDVAVLKDWSSNKGNIGKNAAGDDIVAKARTPYTFFAGPRVAVQVGNALPFIRATYTQKRYNFKLDSVDGAGIVTRQTANETRTGVGLGGGVDFTVTPKMIIGVSYDYSIFGKNKEVKFDTLKNFHSNTSHSLLVKVAYKI